MKEGNTLRILLATGHFFAVTFFALSVFGLSMAPPPVGLDQNLAGVGEKGLILSGKIVSATPATLPNGWRITECTFTGQVIKGNAAYLASEAEQTITFKTAASMVRGLLNCQPGQEGVFSLYGASEPFGLTSFVYNGGANIVMEKNAAGQLVSVKKHFSFQNKSLQQKFSQANPGLASKALTTGSAAPAIGAGLSMEQATDMTRYLAKQLYPTQTK